MPGGPTNKIRGLGELCREVKGLESLDLSIARAGPGAAGRGEREKCTGKAIAAVDAGAVTPLTGDRYVGANATRRCWRRLGAGTPAIEKVLCTAYTAYGAGYSFVAMSTGSPWASRKAICLISSEFPSSSGPEFGSVFSEPAQTIMRATLTN